MVYGDQDGKEIKKEVTHTHRHTHIYTHTYIAKSYIYIYIYIYIYMKLSRFSCVELFAILWTLVCQAPVHGIL